MRSKLSTTSSPSTKSCKNTPRLYQAQGGETLFPGLPSPHPQNRRISHKGELALNTFLMSPSNGTIAEIRNERGLNNNLIKRSRPECFCGESSCNGCPKTSCNQNTDQYVAQYSPTTDYSNNSTVFQEIKDTGRTNSQTTGNEYPQPQFSSKKVYISFKSSKIDEDDFYQIFSKFGRIRQHYICQKKNARGERYGFVCFKHLKVAEKVVQKGTIQTPLGVLHASRIQYKPKYDNKRRAIINHNTTQYHPPAFYYSEEHHRTTNSELGQKQSLSGVLPFDHRIKDSHTSKCFKKSKKRRQRRSSVLDLILETSRNSLPYRHGDSKLSVDLTTTKFGLIYLAQLAPPPSE